MDYGKILTRAWQTIWKHKVLWLFGILASCSGGGGGGGGGGNTGFQFSDGDLGPNAEQFFDRTFSNIPDWTVALVIGAIILFILIVAVLVILLSTVGRIGLIKGTVQSEEEVEKLSFGELFRESLPYFWRVFGLNLLVGLSILVLILVLAAVGIAFAAVTLGLGVLCLIPLICLLVPAIWLAQVVIEQAIIAIVVEDLSITEGLQRGWDVFRGNLGTMIVMALILYLGIGLVVGVIIALPILVIVLPAIAGAIGGAAFDSGQFVGGGILVAALCFVAYLPVLIVLNGGLRAYTGSAWALTYLELTGGERAPEAEAQLPA